MEKWCVHFLFYSVFMDWAGFITEAWYALKLIVMNVIKIVSNADMMNREGPSVFL